MLKNLHHLFLKTYNVMKFFNGIMPCDIICCDEILPCGNFTLMGLCHMALFEQNSWKLNWILATINLNQYLGK
jgi:hypothetical protein